jgi:hypothetical protein
MRKLKLEIETLVVESFSTFAGGAPQGTVKAHNYTEGFDETCEAAGCSGKTWYWGHTCNGRGSCYQECVPHELEDELILGIGNSDHCTGWGCPP